VVADVPFYRKPVVVDQTPLKVDHILDAPLKSRREFNKTRYDSWIRSVNYDTQEGGEALRNRFLRARLEIFNSEQEKKEVERFWRFTYNGIPAKRFSWRFRLSSPDHGKRTTYLDANEKYNYMLNVLHPWMIGIEKACMEYKLKHMFQPPGAEPILDQKPAYYDVWMHPGNRRALKHFENELVGRRRRHALFFGLLPWIGYAIHKIRRPFGFLRLPILRITFLSSIGSAVLFPLATTPWFRIKDLEWALKHFMASTGNFAAAKLRLGLQDYYFLAYRKHPMSFPKLPHDKWDALVLTSHDREVAQGIFSEQHQWIHDEHKYEEMITTGQGPKLLRKVFEKDAEFRQNSGNSSSPMKPELSPVFNPPSIRTGHSYYAKFLPKSELPNAQEKYLRNMEFYTALLQFFKGEAYSYFGYGFLWDLAYRDGSSAVNSLKWASRISWLIRMKDNVKHWWNKTETNSTIKQ